MARCATCGHGYGVHFRYDTALRIDRGRVEFYESHGSTPDLCTGYPDMLARDGRRCECRSFIKDPSERW